MFVTHIAAKMTYLTSETEICTAEILKGEERGQSISEWGVGMQPQ